MAADTTGLRSRRSKLSRKEWLRTRNEGLAQGCSSTVCHSWRLVDRHPKAGHEPSQPLFVFFLYVSQCLQMALTLQLYSQPEQQSAAVALMHSTTRIQVPVALGTCAHALCPGAPPGER